MASTGTDAAASEPTAGLDAAGAAGELLPSVGEMRLPAWFFGFEGVLAGAFDLLRAFPSAWPALILLVAANITVSLTLLRKRLKLAKLLWRGKGTRKVAFALVGLRIGTHVLLGALGFALVSALGHVLMALAMAGITVGLMVYVQRTALTALVTAGKATA
ncbi:hypothetical protein F7Q99_28415 [Streptomyces kaniharaensis]|uniref:Uncharacterized protein n=1 Tax=Streptomyces kaniharaensis TaxID=212423 RepID=A0A6N7KX13_9ACTN|nr:hypothetical protein [Streptomyces kaniharaensis]MQS16060.1 hypothetical protein [Streptomyces kaniharaensis]